MNKLTKLIQKRQEMIAVLTEPGVVLPPPPPPGESVPPPPPADMLKNLELKEAEAKAELEKTTDPAKKAEIQGLLEKIHQKRSEVIAEAIGEELSRPKLTLVILEEMLAALKARNEDVRAKIGKTEDAQKRAEFEADLKKIIAKTENVKAKIAEAKAGAREVAPEKTIR